MTKQLKSELFCLLIGQKTKFFLFLRFHFSSILILNYRQIVLFYLYLLIIGYIFN